MVETVIDTPRRSLVVGLGNPDRGDDAAGRIVARRLAGTLPDAVEVIELDGEATEVIARLDGADCAFLIDASAAGGAPGMVREFDVTLAPLPRLASATSTHSVGIEAAIEIARALGQLPPRCIVYAIEGSSFDVGVPPSSPVTAAIEAVAARIRAELTRHANSESTADA